MEAQKDKFEEVKEAFLDEMLKRIKAKALAKMKFSQLSWHLKQLYAAKVPKSVNFVKIDLRRAEAMHKKILDSSTEVVEEIRSEALEGAKQIRAGGGSPSG